MLNVEDWAEIRRLHQAEGLPIKMIARVMKVSRNGQVSIPAEARARWGADRVVVVDLGDRVVLRPVSPGGLDDLVGDVAAPVVDADAMPVVGDVEREVSAHHRHSDHPEIGSCFIGFCHDLSLVGSLVAASRSTVVR